VLVVTSFANSVLAFRNHFADIREVSAENEIMASSLLPDRVISKQGGMYEEATFIDRIALLVYFLWVNCRECDNARGWQSAA
jgi:hypothetical protein